MIRILALILLPMLAAAPVFAQTPDRSQRPDVGPAPSLNLPAVERHMLDNGVEVLFMQADDVPLIQMNLIIEAGRVHDPSGMPGLASLTAAMLDRGAAGKSALELSDAFEYLGARFFIAAREHYTQLSLRAPSDRFADAVELLADVLLRPHFESEEIQRLRTERITSLIRRHDEPIAVASQAFGDLVLGADHPYARPAVGSEEFLRTVERDALVDFHQRMFVPNKSTIVMAGAVTDGVLQTVNGALADWPGSGDAGDVNLPAPPAPSATRIVLIDNPGAAQSVVQIGHPGTTRLTDDYHALLVMNTVLGGSFTSRLNQNLREDKGYTYGARSSFDFLPETGRFSAGASVFTAVTAPSLTEFMNELNAIHQPLPEEEVDRARNFLAMRYPQNFQSVSNMASMLTDVVIYGLDPSYLNDYPQRVLSVSSDAVARVAREYVQPQNMTIVVVGDRSAIEDDIRALGIGEVEVMSVTDVLGPVPTASR
jgi:zinc protease